MVNIEITEMIKLKLIACAINRSLLSPPESEKHKDPRNQDPEEGVGSDEG